MSRAKHLEVVQRLEAMSLRLAAADALCAALSAVIADHNADLGVMCANNLTCGSYLAHHRLCPECPRHYRIDFAHMTTLEGSGGGDG